LEEEMGRTQSVFAAICFLLALASPSILKAQRHSLFDESAIVSDLKYARMSYKKFAELHKDAYCNNKMWVPEDGQDINLQHYPNQSPSFLKKSDYFTCCVDDFGVVLGASAFKLLRNNVCGIYFIFSDQRLSRIDYTLKAQSVSLLVPEFARRIGQLFTTDDCGYRTPETCRAMWMIDGYVVELITNVPYGDNAHDGVAIEAKPKDKYVKVSIMLLFS
jgi:hypothetical protein